MTAALILPTYGLIRNSAHHIRRALRLNPARLERVNERVLHVQNNITQRCNGQIDVSLTKGASGSNCSQYTCVLVASDERAARLHSQGITLTSGSGYVRPPLSPPPTLPVQYHL